MSHGFGPAVVAAIERKDGAIKRVWVRYKNKLKGLPLEFVRMAVAEEHEAAAIAKEALEDLAKQLEQGRVNAEVPEEESSSSSSSLETEQRKIKKKKAPSVKVTFPPERKESPPDPRYPMVEFSDEEDEGKGSSFCRSGPIISVGFGRCAHVHPDPWIHRCDFFKAEQEGTYKGGRTS